MGNTRVLCLFRLNVSCPKYSPGTASSVSAIFSILSTPALGSQRSGPMSSVQWRPRCPFFQRPATSLTCFIR